MKKKKKTSYVLYADANNLYGWAMMKPLPIGNFEWITKQEFNFDNAEKGFILEIDLEYPEHLHDLHNGYPLAPESLEVQDDWLSPYQKDLLQSKLTKVKNTCSKFEKQNQICSAL